MPHLAEPGFEQQHWTQVAVRENELVGLLFNQGWLTGRATIREEVTYNYDRWPSIAGGTGRGAIVGTTDIDIPQDANGRSILYHEFKRQIWQCFIGISPAMLRVFWEFPLRQVHKGIRADVGKPDLAAAAASVFGEFFNSHESFYGEETAKSMFYLPYKTEVGLGAFNEASYVTSGIADNTAGGVRARFIFNKLIIEPLNPEDRDDAQLIGDILRRRVKAHLWGPGTDGFKWAEDMRNIYDVDPVIIKGRKIFHINKDQQVIQLAGSGSQAGTAPGAQQQRSQ